MISKYTITRSGLYPGLTNHAWLPCGTTILVTRPTAVILTPKKLQGYITVDFALFDEHVRLGHIIEN